MTDSITFDRAANYYDETRGFPPGVEQPVGEMVAKAGGFTKTSRVLEVGIGTGRIGLPVSAHVQGYYGVDLSAPMMQRLRQKQTTEPVYLAQADATRLPFPDHSFDGAVSVHVFHLIPTWQQALQEVKRVLKPGALLLNCWNSDHDRDSRITQLWDAWNATIPVEDNQRVGARADETPDFIDKEGWQPQGEIVFHTFAYTFTVARHLEHLRHRVWSRLWGMRDEDIEAGIAAVEAVASQLFEDDHEPAVLGNRFNVQAYRPNA